VAATGLWLGFRHQQSEQLRSMEEVIRLQDENLRLQRTPDHGPSVAPPENSELAATSERQRSTEEGEDAISEEDLAVMENLELLQDYDFLRDLAETSNGGDVRTN
jgi:hypothetical protein